MFRLVLVILYTIGNDCDYLFRLGLAILKPIDSDYVSANISHSVAY